MKKEQLVWRTATRKVNDLIPFERNPRKISDDQLEALKRSLKRFNLVELPVIDLDGKVAAGHQRLKVLQLLGRGEEIIECRIPNRKLTKEEFESYLLTSNAVKADWDYDLLRSFDSDILLSIGFSDDDLSHLWDDVLEVEGDDFNVERELKRITKPTAKLGELYQLGPHRLLCADATDEAAVRKLVGDVKIDLVDVDPPFNIGLSYDKGVGGKASYGGKTNDSKSDAEYKTFLQKLLANSLAVTKPSAHFFMWCDQRYIGLLQELYKAFGINHLRVCVWIKGAHSPTPNCAFNKTTEFCAYGTKGFPHLSKNVKNLNEIANKEVGTGNRAIDDVYDMFDLWLAKRLPATEYSHPTTKPPNLHEKALRRCSRAGDAVLDLTAGSGSLMIACEQMKRRAFLTEVDPVFATLIINRYEKLTGDKAKKLN